MNKKARRPIIFRDTYKQVAGCFLLGMWLVSIIAIVQTISSCQATYMAYGTTLAVYEAFTYSGILWGTASILLTIVWTVVVGMFFIVGRFLKSEEEYNRESTEAKIEATTIVPETPATEETKN